MHEIATVAGVALTGLVGLLLGLVGGGGSIVVVPILVYVLGLSAPAAIALSLPIVGVTALVGALIKARRGQMQWRALMTFGLAGSAGAIIGAKLTRLLPAPVLLLLFATLLLLVGLKTLAARGQSEITCDNQCHTGRCLATGALVGVLTGFLGVGGGFLLVPALRKFARQNMATASGTSLGIIALNSTAGFLSHRNEVQNLLPLALLLTGVALLGLWIGLWLAPRFEAQKLEKMFGAVALLVALYLFAVNIAPAVKLLS